ncbi:toxin-activating lysine-acyltransferase [Glaesserella parasuis]|uniref:RTX toxin-activating lysine-acyltransferase n=1 Tax=Glaesserella parasuis TaxID=738 RepID=A0AAJ6AFQ9_GLAPU|nr:toxin-activating lysine-acyltransferase [Glaesserella parasuis]MDG6361695.1 toxin-activating lysine-acyltransferase [Glaesserella parasuis]MDG6772210.1 toxin-activating lysine-acyltransferase [Glaesserella parasuis]MDO9815021.1 toxin-activating lysine-acyltransferase [Glaesserella parasuis]QKJ70418.1 toxin-activating lysine-acyltransferase [Glaesserella parasuis]WGE10712.1 toxin-activating lysine-acyltransferase [Glaesserella parasuis]
MLIDNIEIICPAVYPKDAYSSAEVFGSMIWLWSKFDYYSETALGEASELILATITSKNFALFCQDGQPVGYVNWAWLDKDQAEKCKLKQLSYRQLIDCQEKGEDKQLWILSWFCLSEKSNHFTMYRLLNKVIFKGIKVHFSYHKSAEGSLSRFYTKQC